MIKKDNGGDDEDCEKDDRTHYDIGKDEDDDEDDGYDVAVCQGCISCGILVSGIRARGVNSEHMENMEMFSCSPT